jgi:hypothetical protein
MCALGISSILGVSYPRLAELPESSLHLASSTQERVEEVVGGVPQAQRVAPTLLFLGEQALRSRSKVKPQWGQLKIRSSSVKPLLIPPQRKHSREVL